MAYIFKENTIFFTYWMLATFDYHTEIDFIPTHKHILQILFFYIVIKFNLSKTLVYPHMDKKRWWMRGYEAWKVLLGYFRTQWQKVLSISSLYASSFPLAAISVEKYIKP